MFMDVSAQNRNSKIGEKQGKNYNVVNTADENTFARFREVTKDGIIRFFRLNQSFSTRAQR